MDEKVARAMLDEARSKLAEIEEQRTVWLNVAQAAEGWLRLFSTPKKAVQVQLAMPAAAKNGASGKQSFRGTVLQVIKDARGNPLKTDEILLRVRAKGVDTAAKDPVGVVDLVAGSLIRESHHPIERVGPRTFRWVGQFPAETSPAVSTPAVEQQREGGLMAVG